MCILYAYITLSNTSQIMFKTKSFSRGVVRSKATPSGAVVDVGLQKCWPFPAVTIR